MIFFILFSSTDLIHITCESRSDTARADIALYEQLVFKDYSPSNILWSMYYNIPSCLTCSEAVTFPRNFYATCGPYFELDYDETVQQVCFSFNVLSNSYVI